MSVAVLGAMSAPVIAQLEYELREAETGLEPLCRREVSGPDYLAFLIRAYGFHASFEALAALVPGLHRVLALEERAKAGPIAADLLALGLRPAEIARVELCPTIPAFRSVEETLGWMYTIERATLGFELVRLHLRAILPREIHIATSFVAAYGDRTDARWRELCAAVIESASDAASSTALIRGAIAAISHRSSWMDGERARKAV